MKYSVFAAALLGASAAYADTPELTVYTYDSFVSDWGPGPAVEKAFEVLKLDPKQVAQLLQFVAAL